MRYRRFGRTGLEVSEIAFGGGVVGGILVDPDDETKLAALRRANEAGVNWIDTAPAYGNGKSEEAIGRLLPETTGPWHLSTKVRLDVQALGDIRGQIERSLEESLARLRVSSVDLLQLHNQIMLSASGNAVGVEHVLGRGGLAESFERLREQGLIRFAGITALGDAAACRQVIASGRFDSAQVYYNLINPSAARAVPPNWSGQDFEGLIADCRRLDMAVMNIRVFAAGVLATEQRHGREIVIARGAAVSDEERRAQAVRAILGDRYGTPAQTALRFSLANPDISCVVVGMATLDHLEEAIAAARVGPLPAEAFDALAPAYQTDFTAAGGT